MLCKYYITYFPPLFSTLKYILESIFLIDKFFLITMIRNNFSVNGISLKSPIFAERACALKKIYIIHYSENLLLRSFAMGRRGSL